MTAVDLTPAQARWLSVLAARALREDAEAGHTIDTSPVTAEVHYAAWEALQPACEWNGAEEIPE